MAKDSLVLRSSQLGEVFVIKLSGTLTEVTSIELQQRVMHACKSVDVREILIDLYAIDHLDIRGLLALAEISANCNPKGKVSFLVLRGSQPDKILHFFAEEDFSASSSKSRHEAVERNKVVSNYIESSDPIFNAAQRELMIAAADYEAIKNTTHVEPGLDIRSLCRKLGDANQRHVRAKRNLRSAREALAINLIQDINTNKG